MPHDYRHAKRLLMNELRLLHPISTSPNSLHFKLVVIPRKHAPTYDAVSYTWGSDEATETIVLDGKPFSVRPNLWACLFHLTNVNGPSNRRCLWVDAICINQTDDEEKTSQVRLMDQTYRDASQVLVWLGLLPLAPGGTELKPANRRHATFQVEDFDWRENLQYIATRSYWKRFWVIQELLLGRDVWIHCGNTSMHWLDFQTMLWDKESTSQYRSDTRDWAKHRYDAMPLIMGRDVDRYPEMAEPLQTLLLRHTRSLCQDPRDRVFALLGLIGQDERLLLGRFLPNYTLSEDEVLVITLAHIISHEGRNLTEVSDDLFLALKIDSKERKKELFRKAKEMDYLGFESIAEFRRHLTSIEISSQMPDHYATPMYTEHLRTLQTQIDEYMKTYTRSYGTIAMSEPNFDWIHEDYQGYQRNRRRWTSGKVMTLGLTLTAVFLVWKYSDSAAWIWRSILGWT